jgi:DNA-binding MarR family transcriptional regulator
VDCSDLNGSRVAEWAGGAILIVFASAARQGRLALTAPELKSCADSAGADGVSAGEVLIEQLARLCKSAIGGRRAARALADWAKRFGLSEAEFHVLWQLRAAPAEGLDQTTLAADLAFSPAQVSATVERLRCRDLVFSQIARGDRRRHLWRLSGSGQGLIEVMLSAAALLRSGQVAGQERARTAGAREAAA